jgi:hypothetical protein
MIEINIFFSCFPANEETKILLCYLSEHEKDVTRKLEDLLKKKNALSFYDLLLKEDSKYLLRKKKI